MNYTHRTTLIIVFSIGIATGSVITSLIDTEDNHSGNIDANKIKTSTIATSNNDAEIKLTDTDQDLPLTPFSKNKPGNESIKINQDIREKCVPISQINVAAELVDQNDYIPQEIDHKDESILDLLTYSNSISQRDELIISQDSILANEEMMDLYEAPSEEHPLTPDEQQTLEEENINIVNSEIDEANQQLFEETLRLEEQTNNIYADDNYDIETDDES